MRATSTTVIVILSKVLLRKLLYHSYVKVSQQQYFEGHPTVEDFMDMDQDTC